MDPSMLIGFLIKDEHDWEDWKRRLRETKGKAIVHILDREPPVPGETRERKEAVDEVVSFDDEEDEDDETVTVVGKDDEEGVKVERAEEGKATSGVADSNDAVAVLVPRKDASVQVS